MELAGLAGLEGQIIGLIIRGRPTVTHTTAPAVAVPVSTTTGLVFATATQHLHFREHYVQGIPWLTVPIGIAPAPQSSLYINLLTPSQVLVADFGEAAKGADVEPFCFFPLFSICRSITATGGHAEGSHCLATGGVPHLGVAPQVADNDDLVHGCPRYSEGCSG